MSRWTSSSSSKSRAAPSYAFPLDSLVKEKENTNRPVAARSAGTVGKWGTTSFTSIRTASYGGYTFKTPADPTTGYNAPASQSPHSDSASDASPGSVSVPVPPKPKKFFKSRNSAPVLPPPPPAQHLHPAAHSMMVPGIETPHMPYMYPSSQTLHHQQPPVIQTPASAAVASHSSFDAFAAPAHLPGELARPSAAPAAGLSPSIDEHRAAPKIRLKISKRQLVVDASANAAVNGDASEFYASRPDTPDQPSVAAAPARKRAPAKKPAKAAKRQRPPAAKAKPAKADTQPPAREPTRKNARSRKAVNYSETRSRSPSPVPRKVDEPTDETAEAVVSPSKAAAANATGEHPPIKLRISMGTAHLIRTDSSCDNEDDHNSSSSDGESADNETVTSSNHDEDDTTSSSLPAPKSPIHSTAELLAVLSDDPVPGSVAAAQQPSTRCAVIVSSPGGTGDSSVSTTFQPIVTNCIKIKIKTNYAHMIAGGQASGEPCSASVLSTSYSSSTSASPPPQSTVPGDSPPKSASRRAPRVRRKAAEAPAPPAMDTDETPPADVRLRPEPVRPTRSTRSTRSTTSTNEAAKPAEADESTDPEPVKVIRSYARKRKIAAEPPPAPVEETASATADDVHSNEDDAPATELPIPGIFEESPPGIAATVQLPPPIAFSESKPAPKPAPPVEPPTEEQPPVKLVISKKKGSIFKSRAAGGDTAAGGTGGASSKRHQLYRHKWDHDASPADGATGGAATVVPTMQFVDDDSDGKGPADGQASSTSATNGAGGSSSAPSIALTRVIRTAGGRSGSFDGQSNGTVGGENGAGASSSGASASALAGTSASLFDVMGGRHSPHATLPFDHWPGGDDFSDPVTSVRCDTRAKQFYTRVRNVKNAHEIQESGEFQEMDDDVVYILDTLQAHNPTATRCLAALQLASKCMAPAFRMHVRAHGTIGEFFRALRDVGQQPRVRTSSLALCTAAVMFVLNQENLNVDLDRDSLALLLALLEPSAEGADAETTDGLSAEQRRRNADKVREICAEIKALGKAAHLNLDVAGGLTAGQLAMETLLSLTAKRTGEWFKEEMRQSGGLATVMRIVCDGCDEIERAHRADAVGGGVQWTVALIDRLRCVERCLRVVENVSTLNEGNQRYMLEWEAGKAWRQLLRFLARCDSELERNPTCEGDSAARALAEVEGKQEAVGIVLRESLVPTLKVLINLTHPFGTDARGAELIGTERRVFATSMHLLFHVGLFVAEQHVFELNILVLLLLMNLTMYTQDNRKHIMESDAPPSFADSDPSEAIPMIRALVEYFYRRVEMAQQVEQNTDAILDTPSQSKSGSKTKSLEEVDETVTKLLQKAGNHMEHTMLASYDSLLIGYLITDSAPYQRSVRRLLRNGRFNEMVLVLEKYYTFMNLTASSEASVVAHIKQTKSIIEYFKRFDKLHAEDDLDDMDDDDDSGASSSFGSGAGTSRSSANGSNASNPAQYRSRRAAAANKSYRT